MYLNIVVYGAPTYVNVVEPKHKMYLNSFFSFTFCCLSIVEPKHKMYLNAAEVRIVQVIPSG